MGEAIDDGEPFEPPEGWEPEAALMQGLAAKANGQPYDESEVALATMALAAGYLVAQGIPEELAVRVVNQAAEEGTIHVTYEVGGELAITIGETPVAEAQQKPLRCRACHHGHHNECESDDCQCSEWPCRLAWAEA